MATSDQAVGEFLDGGADADADGGSSRDDDDTHAPPVVRPALQALLYDQAALFDPAQYERDIEYGLRDGFPDQRRLVEWYQRAVVRTMGHLADEWPADDLVLDHTMIGALVERPPEMVDPLGEDRAEKLRELYEATIVHPACVSAYRSLRTNAGEYVGVDGPEIDPYSARPSKQKNVAMRPGYQILDRQQRHTLTRLWGGFDGRTELLDWLHRLNAPTAGEIDSELAQDVLSDGVAMDNLIHEPGTDEGRAYRVAFAVSELLPAFVAGVRNLSAGEAIQMKRDDNPWNEV